jgi:predicted nucleic acid-binding protein
MPYRYLLDTNLLVYPHDGGEPAKGARSADVLLRLGTAGTAALSAQALSEFSSVLLYKLSPPAAPEEIRAQVERLIASFPVLPLTPFVVLEAVRGVRDHGFSYYEAQIWAAARLAQIPYVLSEDFQEGSTHDGVTFVNPLAAGFDPASL